MAIHFKFKPHTNTFTNTLIHIIFVSIAINYNIHMFKINFQNKR